MCGKIGALRNLLVSLGLVALGLGTVALTHQLYATVFGLTCHFFGAGFMGSSNALATYMLPDRQRGVTLLHALNAVGKFVGPMLASLFLYGAWRNGFLAAAVLPLALAIPVLIAHGYGGSIPIGRKREGDQRAGADFWLAISGFGAIAGSELAVALWIPAYAQEVRGCSAAEANLLLSIFLVGLVIGRFAVSALSPRVSSRRAIAVCGAAALFAIPAVSFSSYPVAAAFFLLFGLAFSATWPSYFAHLTRVFPEHLGLMGGASVFSTQVGFAVCSYVSGRLAEVNLAYPMLFGAAVLGGFVLIFFASPVSKAARGVPST